MHCLLRLAVKGVRLCGCTWKHSAPQTSLRIPCVAAFTISFRLRGPVAVTVILLVAWAAAACTLFMLPVVSSLCLPTHLPHLANLLCNLAQNCRHASHLDGSIHARTVAQRPAPSGRSALLYTGVAAGQVCSALQPHHAGVRHVRHRLPHRSAFPVMSVVNRRPECLIGCTSTNGGRPCHACASIQCMLLSG